MQRNPVPAFEADRTHFGHVFLFQLWHQIINFCQRIHTDIIGKIFAIRPVPVYINKEEVFGFRMVHHIIIPARELCGQMPV